MSRNPINLLLLPGDGIGPEVTKECRRVIEWFSENRKLAVNIGSIVRAKQAPNFTA